MRMLIPLMLLFINAFCSPAFSQVTQPSVTQPLTPPIASQDWSWLQPVSTFIGTYGLAVFLVVYYVLKMYPQVSAERREWIAEVTRLEQLVNPDTRPVTLSQAEVVGDIAIDAYMNKLSVLTADRTWRRGLTGSSGFGEKASEGYISRHFFGEQFQYDPKKDDAAGLRKMVRKFAEEKKKVNSDSRAQLSDVLKRADESAEKIQYQLARLRFQNDSLAEPWHAALTAVRETWNAKLKDIDFVDVYDRRRFIEFIEEHPAYEQLKNDPELIAAVAENPFGVKEMLDLTKDCLLYTSPSPRD